MEIQFAVSKTRKYAVSSSGDTVEMIERPNGGISVVMADGQSSGRGAKIISGIVVRKVIALLADGVRDGAAARAASDYLFTERNGKVSATLNILSVDLHSKTLVLTCNNPAPVLIARNAHLEILDHESQPIGLHRDTRPVIHQIDLVAGLTAVVYTDGLVHAGSRAGKTMDAISLLQDLLDTGCSPQDISDTLLKTAYDLDDGRPSDDISVVVLQVLSHTGDDVRRMSIRLPLEN